MYVKLEIQVKVRSMWWGKKSEIQPNAEHTVVENRAGISLPRRLMDPFLSLEFYYYC